MIKKNCNYYNTASKTLLEKIISEFSYEDILSPVQSAVDQNLYTLNINPSFYYVFKATKMIYGNLIVHKNSVMKYRNDVMSIACDAIDFIIDTIPMTNIDPITTAHFIKELNNTLYADIQILKKERIPSKEIYKLPYAQVEGMMTGHPWFVINKGRIGFNATDHENYAPEMQNNINLQWLAINKNLMTFSCVSDLDYSTILNTEIDNNLLNEFNRIIIDTSQNPDDFFILPVHPWQWENSIQQQFTKYIFDGDIIFLGQSTDKYLSMQSIRSFSNISHPEKHSIKLPLNILNTAVYRGLPEDQTINAPILTEWVKNIAKNDTFITKCNFILLGETASAYCKHPYYSETNNAPYYFTEQLGAIWRESIHTKLHKDERAITMATLTYVDQDGQSIICEMISESRLSIDNWLDTFFENTIPALLHFLYKYGMVFSPHGENSILIIKDNMPVGLAMKDFVDDINISQDYIDELNTLPDSVKHVIPRVDDDYLLQFIQTGLFVVHYRYISSLLTQKLNYPEIHFYMKLHQCIERYQKKNPELAHRFNKFDLYKKSFSKLCLNRLRIFEVGYADYSVRPKVIPTGKLDNPLYLGKAFNNFSKTHYQHKRVSLRPFNINTDLDTIYNWMNNPHVAEFWNLNKSKEYLKNHFCKLLSTADQYIFILAVDGKEIAYAEVYNAKKDNIAKYCNIKDDDYGWHLLIGAVENIGQGYSKLLVQALSKYCFYELDAKRVIFEPDTRVIPFQKIASRIGYENEGEVSLPDKNAYLFTCSKDSFTTINAMEAI